LTFDGSLARSAASLRSFIGARHPAVELLLGALQDAHDLVDPGVGDAAVDG